MIDPFEQLYTGLYNIVARDPRIASLVRPKNIINYAQLSNTTPTKESLAPGDVPEIVLLSSSAGFNLHSTSSTCSVVRRFNWLITTGDIRITGSLYKVEWALFCAMVGWRDKFGQLVWPEGSGWRYVKRISSGDANEGLVNREQNRGLTGWASLWSCEAELHFRTQDLQLLRTEV